MLVTSTVSDQAPQMDSDSAPAEARASRVMLTGVVTIGANNPAAVLFKTLRLAGVKAVFDIRFAPDGKGVRIRQKDFAYMCKIHGVEYHEAPEFMPSRVMTARYGKAARHQRFDSGHRSPAWTRFLQDYARCLRERDPLSDGAFTRLGFHGRFTTVALLGTSEWPQDCHRQYALARILHEYPSLRGEHLMSEDSRTRRKGLLRVLLKDLPDVGLLADNS